jgi:hypothetical protein
MRFSRRVGSAQKIVGIYQTVLDTPLLFLVGLAAAQLVRKLQPL